MNKDVIIIGYSGHSYEIIESLMINDYHIKGYCEPKEKNTNPFSIQYLGDEAQKNPKEFIEGESFFIAIGDNNKRHKIGKYIIKNNGELVNAIHPSSSISKGSKIGKGNFIGRNSSLNYNSTLGDNVIINTSSVIEHDSLIKNGVHIGPGAVICGGVIIKEQSFVGANSTIRENIIVGKNVIIGAGSVVVSDIPDNSIYFGNPAKFRDEKR